MFDKTSLKFFFNYVNPFQPVESRENCLFTYLQRYLLGIERLIGTRTNSGGFFEFQLVDFLSDSW
jgi:hypothetical protein